MKLCNNKTCELSVGCNLYSEMAIEPYAVKHETKLFRDDFGEESIRCNFFRPKKYLNLGSKINNEKAAAIKLEIVQKYGGDQKEILMHKLNTLCKLVTK